MKIYVSGKISGLPIEEVKEKFIKADKYLKTFGYEVVSPFDNGLLDEAPWQEHMIADIAMLLPCDAIYMLPDWGDSKGAMIEKYIAQMQGKGIMYESKVEEDRRQAAHLEMVLFKVESAIQEVTGLTLADYTGRSRGKQILYYARMIFTHHCFEAGITNKSLLGRYLKRGHVTQGRALAQYAVDFKFTPEFRAIAERVNAIMQQKTAEVDDKQPIESNCSYFFY